MIRLAVTMTLLAFAPAAFAAAVAADWTSATGGILDSYGFTFTAGNPYLTTADLSGANYTAFPLSATQEVVGYDGNSDWTVDFSDPVSGVLLYLVWWRGVDGRGPATYSYTFSAPFTIVSGGAGVTQVGNTLQIPNSIWGNGILRFSGPLASLSVDSNYPDSSRQVLTLAADVAVPEPSTLAIAGLAGLMIGLAAIRRRSLR